MRESLPWSTVDLPRFQRLATAIGPIPGKHAAIAVGAISYLSSRADEVRRADQRSGYNWSAFPWKDYREKLDMLNGRLKDVADALAGRLASDQTSP
jgi:hypothetical protein